MQEILVSSMLKRLWLQNKLEQVGLAVNQTETDHQNLIPKDEPGDAISNEGVLLDSSSNSVCGSFSLQHGEEGEQNELESYTTDDCINMDSFFPAPPLQDLYRYHIFFTHSPHDNVWVEGIVNKLEDCPYYYKCYYNNNNNRTSKNKSSNIQSTLCAAMLSERVVIVLSRNYVCSTWFEFQEILQNLTDSSLHQQRMVVIKLEDCDSPEPLKNVGYLDVRQKNFYHLLTQTLRSDCLPRSSESISSGLSSVLSSRTNLSNGQLLATVTGKIKGQWKATLVFDSDGTVPTPLSCHGINVNYNEYANILNTILEDPDIQSCLSWQFTIKPFIVICILIVIWTIAFLLVIFLLIDAPKSSALPIRLSVFLFPLVLLLAGYSVRKMQKQQCATIALQMLKKCVHINQLLYQLDRPVLLTASHNEGHKFFINFIYFDIGDCVANIHSYLDELHSDESEKLMALIEFYTMDAFYLTQGTLAERIVVMLAAPYSLQLLHRLLLKPHHEHHISGHMCLCQYTEEFTATYFASIKTAGGTAMLSSLFSKYLNCSLRKNSMHTVREILRIDERH